MNITEDFIDDFMEIYKNKKNKQQRLSDEIKQQFVEQSSECVPDKLPTYTFLKTDLDRKMFALINDMGGSRTLDEVVLYNQTEHIPSSYDMKLRLLGYKSCLSDTECIRYVYYKAHVKNGLPFHVDPVDYYSNKIKAIGNPCDIAAFYVLDKNTQHHIIESTIAFSRDKLLHAMHQHNRENKLKVVGTFYYNTYGILWLDYDATLGEYENIMSSIDKYVDDMSWYKMYPGHTPGYSHGQAKEIKQGVLSGVDTSMYSNPNFSEYQMGVIRAGLEEGLNAVRYADPTLTFSDMLHEYHLMRGTTLDDLDMSVDQLEVLDWAEEHGMDWTRVCDKRIRPGNMKRMLVYYDKGVDVSKYYTRYVLPRTVTLIGNAMLNNRDIYPIITYMVYWNDILKNKQYLNDDLLYQMHLGITPDEIREMYLKEIIEYDRRQDYT